MKKNTLGDKLPLADFLILLDEIIVKWSKRRNVEDFLTTKEVQTYPPIILVFSIKITETTNKNCCKIANVTATNTTTATRKSTRNPMVLFLFTTVNSSKFGFFCF